MPELERVEVPVYDEAQEKLELPEQRPNILADTARGWR